MLSKKNPDVSIIIEIQKKNTNLEISALMGWMPPFVRNAVLNNKVVHWKQKWVSSY